jgi:rhamnosyltransferase
MRGKIALGIVVFKPKKNLFQRVQKALNCGFSIYIYDNSPDIGKTVEYCSLVNKEELVYLSEKRNMGLAKGISAICKHAYSAEVSAIINFDQDTIFTEKTLNYINHFYKFNEQLLHDQGYSVVGFNSEGLIGSCGEQGSGQYEFVNAMLVRNSGSLFFLDRLKKIGWHDNGYFVDGVDYEFCLRSINAGFRIGECNCAPDIDHESEQGAETYAICSKTLRKYPISRVADSISANIKLLFSSMIGFQFSFMAEVFRLFVKYLFSQALVRILSTRHIKRQLL